MKLRRVLFAMLLAVPAMAQVAPAPQISGDYLEFRTADIYTGPCIANSEVNLSGHEAVLAWRIERGTWGNVPLDGLAVVAVVRARATLGDPYTNPLPAKTVFVVDARASAVQRAALVHFAQAQTAGLLENVVAVETAPIQFAVNQNGHGYAQLEAGKLVRLETRPIGNGDHLCSNETVFYDPLAANLTHAMPAVATESTYRGNHLSVTWKENGRRSSFVGSFAF